MGKLYACIKGKEKEKRNHGIKVVFFTNMGDAISASGPKATTFAFLGDLVNIINCKNFGIDRFTGFRSVKYRKGLLYSFTQAELSISIMFN